MAAAPSSHIACVDAWLARTTASLPPEGLIRAFELGFAALWRRSHQTLGDVTLTAIVDRVLHTAAERHPALSGLTLTPAGLSSRDLFKKTRGLSRVALEDGIRFVLVEYLTVLGNLTAEILTESLHAELAKLGPPKKPGRARRRTAKTASKTVGKAGPKPRRTRDVKA